MPEFADALTLFKKGDHAASQALCDQLWSEGDRSAALLNLFGLLAAQRGDTVAAARHFEQACASAPDQSDYWYNLSGSRRRNRAFDAAVAAAFAAVNTRQKTPQMRANVVRTLIEAGRIQDAARFLENWPESLEAAAHRKRIKEAYGRGEHKPPEMKLSPVAALNRMESLARDALLEKRTDDAHVLMSAVVSGYKNALQIGHDDFALRRQYVVAQNNFIIYFQPPSRKKEQVARSFFRELEDIVLEGRRYLDAFGPDYEITAILVGALGTLGRLAEAEWILKAYLTIDPGNEHARVTLAKVLIHSENIAGADELIGRLSEGHDRQQLIGRLNRLKSATPPLGRFSIRRWPKSCAAFSDFRGVLANSVADSERFPRIIGKSTRITTMGSCFAHNLAAALVRKGMDAVPFPFGEEINSTYANRLIFEAAERNAEGLDYSGQSFTAEDVKRLSNRLAETDVFVLTLGVSEGFFDTAGHFKLVSRDLSFLKKGEFGGLIFRPITLEENITNVRHILAAVRRLQPRIQVVLTVSPVPLSATFGDKPVFQADCLSKSTLRLAAEAVAGDDGVHYWPSFEAVRWMGAHMDVPQGLVYGADDGQSRSVSRFIVDAIMERFLEVAGKDEEAVAEA